MSKFWFSCVIYLTPKSCCACVGVWACNSTPLSKGYGHVVWELGYFCNNNNVVKLQLYYKGKCWTSITMSFRTAGKKLLEFTKLAGTTKFTGMAYGKSWLKSSRNKGSPKFEFAFLFQSFKLNFMSFCYLEVCLIYPLKIMY